MQNLKTVIAYLHTHFDPEWYRTLDEFNIRLVEIFDIVLGELKSGSMPSFYFDGQILALLNYLKFRPKKRALIKKLVKDKKLFIGPFFASVDSFLISGKSLIKNLELGIKIAKDFGQEDFIGYLADTFGHSASIFDILKQFNINKAIIWRGVDSSFPANFRANGINTVNLVRGYYQDILHSDIPTEKMALMLEDELDKIAQKSDDVILLPIGADHLAPPLNAVFLVDNINKHLKKYKIELKNPFEYFNLADFSKFEYKGEFLDNSNTYILPGVYSARIPTKIENAKMEWELFCKAEPLNFALNGKYNSELDFAAVELTKNHAHDSIYGCSIDEVQMAVDMRNIKVKNTAKTIEKNLIRDFKKQYLMEKSPDMAGIFNFSKYSIDGVAKIISDKKIDHAQKIRQFKSVSDDIFYDIYKNPMTEDFHTFFEYLIETGNIEGCSFSNIKINKPNVAQTAGEDFIENPYLKLFILEDKIFALNKQTGALYPDFISLLSTKDEGDSYNFAPKERPKTLKLKSSKAKIKGDIKSTLELVFEENIKMLVSLTNKSKYFEIEISFKNKKKNRKLQISINTGKPLFKTIAEVPCGKITRNHDPNYFLFDNMPPYGKEELKTGSYPMSRYVMANGAGVITCGLSEYEVYRNSVKITLLRSIGIISNPTNKARKIPAGPPIKCPKMQCIGEYSARLGITFENCAPIADEMFDPFIAIMGKFRKPKLYNGFKAHIVRA